jgi:hypothetical protein
MHGGIVLRYRNSTSICAWIRDTGELDIVHARIFGRVVATEGSDTDHACAKDARLAALG